MKTVNNTHGPSLSSMLLFVLYTILVVVVNSPLRVQGQEVVVEDVRTSYVVVSWDREGDWFDVKDFNVTLTFDGKEHYETISCNTWHCICNTSDTFGIMEPCTDLTLEVSGRDYTAPSHNIITAPSGVRNVNVVWIGSPILITWVNPDIETESTCYNNTFLNVTNRYNTTDTFTLQHNNESIEYPVCVTGYVVVSLWITGGDGHSDITTVFSTPEDFDMETTIEEVRCVRSQCSSYQVEWDYIPACIGVSNFEVTADSYAEMLNLSTDTTTVTDKRPGYSYYTCVKTVDAYGNILGRYDCQSCKTLDQVVNNLEVWAPNTNTVKATWDPTSCPDPDGTTYRVSIRTVSYGYYSEDSYTEETSITYTGYELDELSTYRVCVHVYNYGGYDDNCKETTTLPGALDCVVVSARGSNTLFVDWYPYYSYNHGDFTIKYKVSWGSSLEHSYTTSATSYTIDGYNSFEEAGQVCVAVIANPGDIQGANTCYSPSSSNYNCPSTAKPHSGLSSLAIGLIVSVVVLVCIPAIFSLVLYIYVRIKRQRQARQSQSMEVLANSNRTQM